MMLPDAFRRFLRDTAGSVLTVTAISTPIAVGFAALGVETALWYNQKAKLQNAADAAALAGAYELRAGKDQPTIVQIAVQEAQRNGYVVLPENPPIVNVPPQSGSYGLKEAVEVVLAHPMSLLFSSYFLSEPGTIKARAVAKINQGGEACILALDPSAGSAITFTGNTDVRVKNCLVTANSKNSEAVIVSGSAYVEADCVLASGGIAADDGLHLTSCDKPVAGAPPTADPLAALAFPTTPQACTQTNLQVNGNPNQQVTLSPGRYCGSMKLQAGKITLQAGTYIVEGDLTINANAQVTGTGVTIVLPNAGGSSAPTITLNGGAAITLAAPTSGTYAGVLFMQGRAASTAINTINGNSSTNFTGTLYFPAQKLRFLGNNTAAGGCMHIIGRIIEFQGNAGVGNNCSGTGTPTIPIVGTIRLVE